MEPGRKTCPGGLGSQSLGSGHDYHLQVTMVPSSLPVVIFGTVSPALIFSRGPPIVGSHHGRGSAIGWRRLGTGQVH